MTDDELIRAMEAINKVAGLNLTGERITRALPAYKEHLAAIEAFRRVDLPIEAEPASHVRLSRGRRS